MTSINKKTIMEKLTILLEKRDIKVGAIKIDEGGLEESIHVYIIKGKKLSKPIKMEFKKIENNIYGIENFGKISYGDMCTVLNRIIELRDEIQTIPQIKGMGWQVDDEGNYEGFIGAYGLDRSGDNCPIDESEYGKLHQIKGNKGEYQKSLENFIKDSVPRQVLTLGVLSSVLCPIVNQNIVIGLSGETSMGKTSVAKYLLAMFTSTKDRRTYKSLSATENSILASLVDNKGIPNLIDDASLSKSRGSNFERFLYCVASGEERARLGKGYKFKAGGEWKTTTIITAEENVLERCQDNKNITDAYGIVGRVITVKAENEVLFNSQEECKEYQKLTEEQYGLFGMSYVEWLLKNKGLDRLEGMYYKELARVTKDSQEENVLRRIQEKVAMMTLTGKLLEEAFGMKFDIEGVERYVMETSRENLEMYRAVQPRNIIKDEVYKELIECAKEKCPEFVDEYEVFIPSEIFNPYIKGEWTEFKPLQIRRVLKEEDLLEVNVQPNSYTKSHHGKSIKGICLKVKKEKRNE